MRPTRPVALCWVALCSVWAGPGRAAEVSALEILDKSYDPLTKQLEFELRNRSGKAITAWRLSLARSDSHGHGQKSILDQDRLPTPLEPGEILPIERRLEVGDGDDVHTALSLEVIAVVFADLSYEGDAEAAETILAARAARVEEMGAVLRALEIERQQGRSREAWKASLGQRARLLREGSEKVDEGGDSPGAVAAQRSATQAELAAWLEAVADELAVAVDPQTTLDQLTTGLRDQYEKGRQALPEPVSNGNAQEDDKGGSR